VPAVIPSKQTDWSLDVLVGPDLDGTCDSGDAHTDAGIENMQILYGIDNGQDGVVDYYTDGTNIDSKGDWSKIIEVKISLLARSELDNNFTDSKTYTLGDETVTPAGHYHRSLISSTSFIHNLWYGVVGDQSDL